MTILEYAAAAKILVEEWKVMPFNSTTEVMPFNSTTENVKQ